MRRINWVVYAKKPFGGPAQVLAYLGRYTHRVAIANSRLVALDDDHVAFTWKDYRQNGATKIMKLKPDEFIRRFLLHTLPDGFHRIRHFGFMANGHRAAKLALCRSLLSIVSGQRQTMASRRLWIRTLRRRPRFPPVLIVVASCASSSAFDTASAVPALEPNRSGATHREPAYAVHDDRHSSLRSHRLDHRRRCRIRAATQRDG